MHYSSDDLVVSVIGLGYVGLPLAVEFGGKVKTIGYDIDRKRIEELKDGFDNTGEVGNDKILSSKLIRFSNKVSDIKEANFYIVTVPTPIDDHLQPDLTPLIAASELLGKVISKGDTAVFESTVFPGATEEVCIPIIEEISGLTLNSDFWVGYSPERINPGDKDRPVTSIVKVTSGSNSSAARYVDDIYRMVIKAGTHSASSIKVAEASKVIENTQRDVNIALVNELAMIFNLMGINTSEVIDAASTKWNFINLKPGLVGGHCIGVDPYYLVHKSMAVGHIPDIIRKAREINDGMSKFAASKLIKEMIVAGKSVNGANVLVAGLAFKENCPDLRNTKVVDFIAELKSYGINVAVFDPLVSTLKAEEEFGISLYESPKEEEFDVVVLAVAHAEFLGTETDIFKFGKEGATYFDMKNVIFSEDHHIVRL